MVLHILEKLFNVDGNEFSFGFKFWEIFEVSNKVIIVSNNLFFISDNSFSCFKFS